MSTLWPFDKIFDISIPTGGSEFDILTTAFVSALVPFIVATCAIQLSCWLCCSAGGRSQKAGSLGSEAQTPRLVYDARRWVRQAIHDRQSAANDFSTDYPAYEWVCFKCQQSAEKAVKAALLCKGSGLQTIQSTHDLLQFIPLLPKDQQLEKMLTNLQNCIGFVSFMRYPDKHPYPKVPHDVFSRSQAEQALELTDELLDHVRNSYLELM